MGGLNLGWLTRRMGLGGRINDLGKVLIDAVGQVAGGMPIIKIRIPDSLPMEPDPLSLFLPPVGSPYNMGDIALKVALAAQMPLRRSQDIINLEHPSVNGRAHRVLVCNRIWCHGSAAAPAAQSCLKPRNPGQGCRIVAMLRRPRTLLYILLRQSEKYFKTDMVYLASGGFWSLVGQIVSSVTVLAVSVLLARYLTQDGYGQYKYVLSLVALLSTLSLSGLTSSVLQSTARGFDGALPDGFMINLRWSALMFLGALGIGAYYLLHGNFLLGVGMLVGGCASPIIAGAGLYSVFLAGKKDFARQTIYMIFGVMLLPSAALIAAAVLTRSPLIVVLAYFISNAAGALYFYHRTLAVYRPEQGRKDPGMLSYTKHLSFMGILGGLANNLDQILLFQFVGPAQLAIYNFATGIPDQLKGPLKNLDSMLQARFANHFSGHIRENMRNKSLLLLGFGIVCAAIYIPLAPYIFEILFPRYMDAVPYSQVYALYLLTLPFIPSVSYLASKRFIKEQYIASVLNNSFKIIFTLVGVIGWGLWGLVWAVIAARLAGGIANHTLYRIASKRDSGEDTA